MMIVNKDRLFLENVGAVKELSKVKAKISILGQLFQKCPELTLFLGTKPYLNFDSVEF